MARKDFFFSKDGNSYINYDEISNEACTSNFRQVRNDFYANFRQVPFDFYYIGIDHDEVSNEACASNFRQVRNDFYANFRQVTSDFYANANSRQVTTDLSHFIERIRNDYVIVIEMDAFFILLLIMVSIVTGLPLFLGYQGRNSSSAITIQKKNNPSSPS